VGLYVKGDIYAGHYGITMDKEGFEELRDWMAILVQLLDIDIDNITRKELTRVGAIRFWGGSFHKPPLYRNSPKYYFWKADVPIQLGEYKNKDDLVERIKKIDSDVESIIL